MTFKRAAIDRLEAAAYTVPTDAPESDGTFEWRETTIVVVHATGGAVTGLGYSYGPARLHLSDHPAV